MRKFLYIIIALVATLTVSQVHAATQSCAPAQQAQPFPKAKRSIMGLPLFERAVLIIKKFETLHKPKHWPYVGYGHQVQPGEPYRRGCQLTERQADALLRKDLRKFCTLYRHMGRDSILLAALAYNCGPGVVNKSTAYKQLKLCSVTHQQTGGRLPPDTLGETLLKRGDRNIFKSYASHCRYRGKFHRGLHTRRLTELAALFIP